MYEVSSQLQYLSQTTVALILTELDVFLAVFLHTFQFH